MHEKCGQPAEFLLMNNLGAPRLYVILSVSLNQQVSPHFHIDLRLLQMFTQTWKTEML